MLKHRLLEKLIAIACALCLAGGVMSGVVYALASGTDEVSEPYMALVIVDSASDEVDEPAAEVTDNRLEVPFFVDGEECGVCPIVSGVPYMGVESFCRALGVSIDSAFSGDTLILSGDIDFTGAADGIYFIFNGRYHYVPDGIRTLGGELVLPVETLAKCLGVSAQWDRVQWTVSALSGDVHPMESGDTYYSETDIYWLSRVISAEAGDQPLEGQIGVGNVVLNRMSADAFSGQESVYDVIFAKNQFDVVVNGMIYMEPSATSVIAAKIALEGYDVTGGATFFGNESLGDGYECTAWISDRCFMRSA